MNFNCKIYKILCKEYEDSMNSDMVCSKNIKDKLSNLRQYLDSCGYNLPKPLYKFNIEDKNTHKFLDGIILRKSNDKLEYKEVLNMDFNYFGVY